MSTQRNYDPFGKPRLASGGLMPVGNAKLNDLADAKTRRGFTDHEHLNDIELIHMNGRVYDYNLGRFMSVDPVIQSPTNSQSINPYSYIMNNPLAGIDPTGYKSETIEYDPEKHKVLQDEKGNLYLDDGGDSVLKVESTKSTTSNGVTVTQNFGNNGLSSASISKGGASFSITDIGSPSQQATLTVNNSSSNFNFTQPSKGDHIAQKDENIMSSILDFFDGGKKGDWFYLPGHDVSKRFSEHEALKPYIEAYEAGGEWAANSNEDILIQNFRRQHTTYAKDFAKDVVTILGALGEGRGKGDYGTNSYGSFSLRGQIKFDKKMNVKSFSAEIYNRWSIGSLTRNPFTRKPLFSQGMNSVDMYVQISMNEKLR